MLNIAIRIKLDLKDPFAANRSFTKRESSQTPSSNKAKGMKFKFHGSTPIRILNSLMIESRFKMRGNRSSEVRKEEESLW